MKGRFLAAALCGVCSVAFAETTDKSRPTGRACLSIVNVLNGDEEVLRASRTAGPNQKIVAHLDATAKCEALVGPFLTTGQPVSGWQPQYVDLTPGREMLLPKAPGSWRWEKGLGTLQIYVLFFAPGSKDGAEIRGLANAMQKTRDENILKLQGGKLRELIGRANFDKTAAQRVPKASSEVAGVMRMVVGFEWRDFARAVNFSPEKPGALIFPVTDAR